MNPDSAAVSVSGYVNGPSVVALRSHKHFSERDLLIMLIEHSAQIVEQNARMQQLLNKVMPAIDNLTKNVSDLTTAVTAAVAKLGSTPGSNDAAVQTQADLIAVQTGLLTAAAGGTVPTPPTPTSAASLFGSPRR